MQKYLYDYVKGNKNRHNLLKNMKKIGEVKLVSKKYLAYLQIVLISVIVFFVVDRSFVLQEIFKILENFYLKEPIKFIIQIIAPTKTAWDVSQLLGILLLLKLCIAFFVLTLYLFISFIRETYLNTLSNDSKFSNVNEIVLSRQSVYKINSKYLC